MAKALELEGNIAPYAPKNAVHCCLLLIHGCGLTTQNTLHEFSRFSQKEVFGLTHISIPKQQNISKTISNVRLSPTHLTRCVHGIRQKVSSM